MADEQEKEDLELFYFKVMKDHGRTPGNDRGVTLTCGHSILVDEGSQGDGPPNSWLGTVHHCYLCDKD